LKNKFEIVGMTAFGSIENPGKCATDIPERHFEDLYPF
jgi:hypothetical protein